VLLPPALLAAEEAYTAAVHGKQGTWERRAAHAVPIAGRPDGFSGWASPETDRAGPRRLASAVIEKVEHHRRRRLGLMKKGKTATLYRVRLMGALAGDEPWGPSSSVDAAAGRGAAAAAEGGAGGMHSSTASAASQGGARGSGLAGAGARKWVLLKRFRELRTFHLLLTLDDAAALRPLQDAFPRARWQQTKGMSKARSLFTALTTAQEQERAAGLNGYLAMVLALHAQRALGPEAEARLWSFFDEAENTR
jgi:hypothetical protein